MTRHLVRIFSLLSIIIPVSVFASECKLGSSCDLASWPYYEIEKGGQYTCGVELHNRNLGLYMDVLDLNGDRFVFTKEIKLAYPGFEGDEMSKAQLKEVVDIDANNLMSPKGTINFTPAYNWYPATMWGYATVTCTKK